MTREMTLEEQFDEAMKAKHRWQVEAEKLRPAFEKAKHEVSFWDRRATDLWRQMSNRSQAKMEAPT